MCCHRASPNRPGIILSLAQPNWVVEEEYSGIKFSCELRGPIEGLSPQVDSYLSLDKKLDRYIPAPKGNEGNMSMRAGGGFLIKAAGARMMRLKKEDVSFVYSVDEEKHAVYARGKAPSSETFLHHFIYKAHPGISIILHFHDDSLLGRADNVPSIGPFPYGSLELAREAAKADSGVLRIAGHGFVVSAADEGELFGALSGLM